MNITILSIGKFRNSNLKDDFYEYVKRIGYKISLIEIDIKKSNIKNRDIVKKNEADIIIKNINNNSFKIALDEKGLQFDSIKFSQIINENLSSKEITFIIGGAFGLDKKILSIADITISLSKLTFPHMLVRLILIEQIYRSFTIINNHPYHKI
ncbi:MAG: 23S rRNA (pseudouridine(1915)-N(3))-methyltransferase RlmH [Rickettsiales bacterium]|jgi:23S rRNA (pseudouridine1915-N3)-methyltransferase|nr:23S rRNA (pseudouridine(1915)-N(3))-methyltransferase RlmH [Rickettsiales bacterium]|tara:strand:+ start:6903 stop:7361 length:459 start_codon:yes stop_codon:yes gene_type:complete